MRCRTFSRVGVMERELDDVEHGSLGWSAVDGEGSIVVPKRSGDYTRGHRYWRGVNILNRPVLYTFDNGLPAWAGIAHPLSNTGEQVTIGLTPATTALYRVVIRRRFALSGDPLTCLRAALRRCATDGYPIVESAKCRAGGPDQRGTQQPTSLYRFLEGLCDRTGWEWTVEPRLDENRLKLAIVLRPRLGTWYGRSQALHAGVEVLGDAEQVSHGDRRVNEVIALGKGDTLNKMPIAQAPLESDDKSLYALDQQREGRLSVVVQFPNIADRGRLQRAAYAELRRRFYPTQTVQASVSPAKRGRAAFELLRTGNILEVDIESFDSRPARIMGFTYDPTTEIASLALRAAAHEADYQPEEA